MSTDTSLLGYPYPELSPEALDSLNDRRPTFTPRSAAPRPTGEQFPVRERGAALTAPVPYARPERDLVLLARVSDGLRNEPREGETVFAEAVAGHYGTGPQAVIAPQAPVSPQPEPEPSTGYPEGMVRGMLVGALWDAARWYLGLDPDSCEDCEAENGLCVFHAPRMAKALEYEDLHNFALSAPSDFNALHGVAIAIRVGSADLGDIASLGSRLEELLLARLARFDTDGGSR